MIFSISEILKKADDLKAPADKVKVLQIFDNPVLRQILKCCFDPSIKFLLPKGEVLYSPSKSHENQNVLYSLSKKLYIYIDGHSPANLKQKRREFLFTEFLSSIDAKDAELMVSIKDKKMPYKSLTKTIVKRAFPGLLENE